MSGQIQLFLRPPPNVDFVHGYPGIPSDNQRVGASVKGALEIRTPAVGIAAKWVHIELRKVECLPRGGPDGTFIDTVGGTIALWDSATSNGESKDGYANLTSHDFPFQIRIPESIPPSIALENRAGIRYELIASACLRGKRSWFRKRKSTVLTTSSAVTIDKHELHSTWGVYSQPEVRQIRSTEPGGENVALIVERNQTCFGPGDKIDVIATLKVDPTTPGQQSGVILRGFELSLKESIIFRAGPYSSAGPLRTKEKAQPQVRVSLVAEQKLPINNTIYPTTSSAPTPLSITISPSHTTTTLNAARHIDITYVLCVKALLGTGGTVSMDLPVVISNWQRSVSTEAVRRIGHAVGLSLTTPSPTQPVMRVEPIARPSHNRQTSSQQNQTYPVTTSVQPDEFGYGAGVAKPSATVVASGSGAPSGRRPGSAGTSGTKRPGSAGDRGSRFMIANPGVGEQPPSGAPRKHNASGSIGNPNASGSGAAIPPSSGAPKKWLTAEEEKAKLEKERFENAKLRVAMVQGLVGPDGQVAPPVTSPPPQPAVKAPTQTSSRNPSAQATPTRNPSAQATPPKQGTTPPKQGTQTKPAKFLTAEEEKAQLRRYEEARRRVEQSHGNPDQDAHDSEMPQLSPEQVAGGSGSGGYVAPEKQKPTPVYRTAEQEKAAMRLYEEARMAVERVAAPAVVSPPPQAPPVFTNGYGNTNGNGPLPYESLYPNAPNGGPPKDAPTQLSEKARLKKAFEEQDRAARAAQQQQALRQRAPEIDSGTRLADSDAPPYTYQPPSAPAHAQAEKERLRLRDLAMQNPNGVTVMRSNSGRPLPGPETKLTAPAPAKPMTAAEEKKLLRERYAAEQAAAANVQNQQTSPPPPVFAVAVAEAPKSTPRTNGNPVPPPPPLMPKPPVEYIQETREVDARLSSMMGGGKLP